MNIGFIGLGIMGKPMSKNLLKAGYPLTVFDLNTAAVDEVVACGAKKAGSCAEVAAQSELVITMLPDSPDVKKVVLGDGGVLSALKPGSILVDTSSINPIASREICAEVEQAGSQMIDAPVSGGEPKAIDGTLAFMCGGKQEVFDSISQGLRGNSAAGCYTNLLQRHFNAELLNQSVGGEFFDASALADLSSLYVPTDVIVALGTNDIYGGYTFEQIKANMRAYFAKLKELYGDTRVFVISPPYTADCSNPSKNILPLLQQVSEEIRACCEEYGFYYCNGYDFVPHESKYFTDNAHPNDLGFAEYARSLIAEIEKICGKEKD